MTFQISPLPASRFSDLYGQSDEALKARGVEAMIADASPGYPCRVSLRDAEPGERVLLMNYEHQSADTPFRSSHAIFVIDGAEQAAPAIGDVPEELARRLLSVRAFSGDGHIVDAEIVDGHDAGELFERLLSDMRVDYLHAHYAKYGCFAARVDRA